MKKNKNKEISKFKKLFKGFTLVELLAVIVVLAIIMIIAIPSVLNTMRTAKRKAFLEFAQKCLNETEKTYVQQTTIGSLKFPADYTTYFYDIRNDIGITNPGDYHGIVGIRILKDNDDKKTTIYKSITIFDKDYYLSYDSKSNDELNDSLIQRRDLVEKQFSIPEHIKLENVDFKKLGAALILNDICNWWQTAAVDAATNDQIYCTLGDHRNNQDYDENGIAHCRYRTSTYAYEKSKEVLSKIFSGQEPITCPITY